ncbi:Hypothetical_protein [Hexamita inflata]|uniref:Hypothetical_protein n=1 Tax=Hexamita inflata TaxID=28002 RepID=A0AA86UEU7_9EUKA|nr:Hypothetical protein HINF_LOCUS40604 [Hexamita inflata]
MKRTLQVFKYNIPVTLSQIWESKKIFSNNNSVDFFKQLEVQTQNTEQIETQNSYSHLQLLIEANNKQLQIMDKDIKYLQDCCNITYQNIKIIQMNTNGILKVLK